MHYMFLIYGNETAIAETAPEEMEQHIAKNWSVVEEATRRGVLVGVGALQPTSTSTTIRPKDGKVLTTDGPFAETKEQLGGYYILDCADLDEAIGWAAKMPACGGGCVEIRPLVEIPPDPRQDG